MSGEAKARLTANNKSMIKGGQYPSIATDIWSQGSTSLLGIIQYVIRPGDVEVTEMLVGVLPFGEKAHTGANIALATKRALSDVGVGEHVEVQSVVTVDTVDQFVHKTVNDSASNMKLAFFDFNGDECSGHVVQLSVWLVYKSDGT
jgi:hypothetical protein